MKHLKSLVVIGLILLMTGFADARISRRGKKDGGIKGTITSVGTSGFILTVGANKSAGTGATLKVVCDRNTRFLNGGLAVDPSVIKEGVSVGIVGSMLAPDKIQAMTVTIQAPKHKHKKSKS